METIKLILKLGTPKAYVRNTDVKLYHTDFS